MITLIDKLNNKIKEDDFFLDENSNILKEKVKTSVINLDDHLMSILLNDEEFKTAFFIEKNGILVFDKVKFSWIINNNKFLPDSYTSYKNKIGLTDLDGDFLKNKNDVVLSFPYKDCVLEFDSTKENEDREEVFLNETLSKDYIDTLLSPKVLEKALLHEKGGNKTIDRYDDENLIIKGNNLISLYSLLTRFEGRIKCMYWDILYNTNSDKVPYNDKFKHSSWLTMMKNRLEIAKKLLSKDGVIVIQLDYNEQAYLKVLMDEIFQDGYVSLITVKTSSESGVKVNANKPIKTSEYLLIYCKDKDNFTYKHPRVILDTYEKNYLNYVENVDSSYDDWIITSVREKASQVLKCHKNKLTAEQILQFQIDNADNIFSVRDISSSLKKMIVENDIDKNKIYLHFTSTGKKTLLYKNGEIVFLKNKVIEENGVKHLSKLASDIWTDISWDGIANEGGIVLKNGKKPEKLLLRLLESLTVENDLVLDAYFGTGTTGAVAMKMNRKFIGLEQLDSHYEKSIIRLEEVINGDTTGVSKEVSWNGGGSFVSCELSKYNENIINQIIESSNENIMHLYEEIINSSFLLNYKVDLVSVKEIKNVEEFNLFSLEEKKKILIDVLDKNILYVNLSEIDDESKEVTEVDKNFTRSFYGE
ncbi:MAG: site-specific DNA-methyltransferase [Candidatus Izemoplasmatales bacterium]|nr:site-specific DNA-methyltransferase [Candidatus Izemoplasmatales bacterium]